MSDFSVNLADFIARAKSRAKSVSYFARKFKRLRLSKRGRFGASNLAANLSKIGRKK
ncbi:hypothetical protein CAMRE0001_1367 [Campylobacter rectus RM3267]|uniref:Uncharacterized protein n=1 Tax=Campylobacter rectus RM3267 TaxID=553218 RepID=B9D053_CAMRE|nr:hypothetical protein CAMRE0001_1367 [Campylobacter rectus RM3267]